MNWIGTIGREMDTEPIELSGGLLKICTGLWLLMPFQTFSSSPTFASLGIIPEWIWGVFLLGIGIGHIMALADGSVGWRRAASLLGFLVWFTFAAIFVATNPPALGWVPFGISAIQQGWAYIRLGQLQHLRKLQEGG